jgi:dihydroorotate dehydrogenase (NAD+) catalytic subunit
MPKVSQNKYDLVFSPPVMNAAGTLGYAPEMHRQYLGSFVTNPISLYSRKPARGTRYISYSGGFLLHTGLPNPGIKRVIADYARAWNASLTPIVVHLLAQNKSELAQMVARLEDVEGVAAVELGLSPDIDSSTVYRMGLAVQGEFAVILRLPFDAARSTLQAALDSGIAMVSMAAPRGSVVDAHGAMITGRLYGPGIFPLALRTIQQWTDIGVSVIGAGGVYHPQDVDVMLKAGAVAVQVGPAFWKRDSLFSSEN